jgi:hypothetical protein
MKLLIAKLKPVGGFSYLVHFGILALLPVAIFVLVRNQFAPIALSLVVLSKWRMFAVRPRFWPAIVRANAVDIIVGISVVLFMTHTASLWWQLLWAALYAVWLIVIKPASSTLMISAQAILGQLAGLMALYLVWSDGPLYGLVPLTGLICYLAARHFFDNFDEPYTKLLAYLWGYFGAALAWVLGHWLLFYGVLAQPTLLLSALGYSLAVLYYFDHHGKLSASLRRQFIFVTIAIVIVVLTVSDWGDKVV